MFRTAELGRKIPKQEFKKLEPILRQELLEIQQALLKRRAFPVIIVFAGVDGAGKGETINLLNEWMDPRWIITHAYGEPSDEERERPEFWRFWRDLPPDGRIGMFLSSWYSKPVLDRVYGVIDTANFDERLDRILSFENALADDGAVILKFWMHLSFEAQRKRLKALEKDPLLRWRVTEKDWRHWRMYEQFVEAAERTIMRTNTGKAAWNIVEGEDPNYRYIMVGTIIRDAVRKRIEEEVLHHELTAERLAKVRERVSGEASVARPTEQDESDLLTVEFSTQPLRTVLSCLDLSHEVARKEYKTELKRYQAQLNLLHRRAADKRISTLMVFEGPDAAGKGGAIRRLTRAMDARNYQVHSISAPTDEERAHHYLWRFWRHLSRAGRVTIFDRSWYGRVLVERVEGFAKEGEWRRAYAEINDFEEQLIEHGIVLLKFWIHIDKDEQLKRFTAREQTPHKRWKLTAEDWRNREKWEDYEMAVNDMVQYTSTATAPWILVEGNDKPYARIKILRTVCEKLEQALGPND